jgi:hypothetical protein
MDILIAFAALVALVIALGPHHRRTAGLPRAPLGADLDVDHDVDRVLHDVLAGRTGDHRPIGRASSAPVATTQGDAPCVVAKP